MKDDYADRIVRQEVEALRAYSAKRVADGLPPIGMLAVADNIEEWAREIVDVGKMTFTEAGRWLRSIANALSGFGEDAVQQGTDEFTDYAVEGLRACSARRVADGLSPIGMLAVADSIVALKHEVMDIGGMFPVDAHNWFRNIAYVIYGFATAYEEQGDELVKLAMATDPVSLKYTDEPVVEDGE